MTRKEFLMDILRTYFNKSELKTICFELDIKHDDFPHETLTQVAEGLLTRCFQMNIDIVRIIKKERPHINFGAMPNE